MDGVAAAEPGRPPWTSRRRVAERELLGVEELPGGAGRRPPAGARLRGPALGRRRPAGLRRPARRVGALGSDPRPLHREARAPRAAPGLGRGQGERDHDLAAAARGRGDGAALSSLLSSGPLSQPRRRWRFWRAPQGTPSTQSSTPGCSRSAGRSRSSSCPRPCRGSSPPGSTISRRRRRRCSRTRPSSGRSSGSGRCRRPRDGPRPRRRCCALERKELVQRARRSSVEGEAEYAFRHLLVRDVAYGQIPRAARGGEAPRRSGLGRGTRADRGPRRDDRLALLRALEYARAAGEDDAELASRARIALREAGERAFALNAWATAAELFGSALELWPEDDPQRPYVAARCGAARVNADGTGLELLLGSLDDLESAGDAEEAAETALLIATTFWNQGDPEKRNEYVERALVLVGDDPTRRRA